MFTGIVDRAAEVVAAEENANGRRLTLALDWPDVRHGESVAVNGVCLTAATIEPGRLTFDVIRETLDVTNLGRLNAGDRAHVERSLRVGDRVDGHFVQGHVDGPAVLTARTATDEEWRLRCELSPALAKFVAPKGSVCIDGVSLTVAATADRWFEVALIPTTLAKTALGDRPVGWPFNFEADVLSKTVVTWLERRADVGDDRHLTAADMPFRI